MFRGPVYTQILHFDLSQKAHGGSGASGKGQQVIRITLISPKIGTEAL